MKANPLLRSFTNAFNGILYFFANDRNGRIHLAVAVWVIIGAVYFDVSITEWFAILLCMGFVICMEMLNHALENVCDTIQAARHPLIKTAKDVAAGAVLCSAIISAVIGLIIFGPRVIALF